MTVKLALHESMDLVFAHIAVLSTKRQPRLFVVTVTHPQVVVVLCSEVYEKWHVLLVAPAQLQGLGKVPEIARSKDSSPYLSLAT